MKSGTKAICVAFLATVVVAPAVMAGVVNSNHDMTFKYPTNLKAGACSHCHIPHKAGGAKLWASVPTSGTGWQNEIITNLCYSCHASTTYAGAMQVNPFQIDEHGRDQTRLETGIRGSDPGDIASLPADLQGTFVGSDGQMKCTNCHDVHNNDHRPFIRFNTAPGGQYSFSQICGHCHQRRFNSSGTAKGVNNSIFGYSQHPTDQGIANTPRAAFIGVASEFNISPGAVGAGVSGYNLGGHRNNGLATGAGATMVCATCHAVHGNETSTYSSANDGSVTVQSPVQPFDQLAVLAVGSPGPFPAAICLGCHAYSMVDGVGSGPGTTNTYSHPIGTPRSSWIIPSPPLQTQGYKWGNSNSEDVIVCQTCHDVHYGQPNTSLLYGQIESPSATTNRNCVQCHTIFETMNHHPAGTSVLLGGGMTTPIARASAGVSNWVTMAYARGGGPYTFFQPGGGGNAVMCYTCHNQRYAHGNPASGGIFNATPVDTGSEMCMDCHSSNPSQYTSGSAAVGPQNNTMVDASHYLGTVWSTQYKKTDTWSTTGLSSKWGTVAGNGVMICQSCHTLKLSGPLNGGTTCNNTPINLVQRTGIRTLLEHSGNLETGTTLCTGCHGNTPSGGNSGTGQTISHPAISTGWTTAASAAIVSKVLLANGSVTLGPGSVVTCESCHRPHDAAGGSGALILENCGSTSNKTAGGSPSPASGFQRATTNTGQNGNYVDESTFCNMCHNY